MPHPLRQAPAGLCACLTLLLLGFSALAAPPSLPEFNELHWRQLGPFRGGWASMIEGVAGKSDTFFFGAAGGGVWRTDDAGQTWAPLFQDGPSAAIGAIAVAPSNPDVIYAGTGQPDPRYDVQAGLGVFRSTDGGKHWQSLGLENTRYIGRIWVDPRDANTVLVAAVGRFFGPHPQRGVFRSTDGGRTWTHVLKINDWTGAVDLAADPADPKVIFAAAWEARQWPWLSYFTHIDGPGSGVYRSDDGGATWRRLPGEGLPKEPLGRIGLAATHTAAGTRVYATIDSKTAPGIYRSDDGGERWRRVNEMDASSDRYFGRITAAPGDPDTLYTTGQSIRRCTQGGAACEIIKGSPGGDDYHFIWINPARPDHIAVAADQGAVVSVDNWRTWSSWYNQPTGQFYHLAADDRFPYWVYSGQQDSGTVGIASRSDYGAITFRDWRPVGGDERDYDIPDPEDPQIVYGTGLGGRISRWDGRTGQVANVSPWPVSSYGARPTTVKHRYGWVAPMAVSRTGPVTLYAGSQVLFASTDRGQNWRTISPDLTGADPNAKDCGGNVPVARATACGFGVIWTITPSAANPGEVWVGTDNGLVQQTVDGGATWRNLTPRQLPSWAKVSSIDLGPKPGSVYLAVDNHRQDDFEPHVLASSDGGRTWREATAGLPPHHLVSVVRADPARPGLLYAGTDAGVYVSFDDGRAWRPLQLDLPNAWVRDLLVHGDDLIAATQGRALWVLDDLAPLRQASADLARRPFQLFTPSAAVRVRPNSNRDTPLPPETPVGENPPQGAVIDYWLRDGARRINLEIRDGSGALVQRLNSEEAPDPPKGNVYFSAAWLKPRQALPKAAGHHRVVWNLRYERPKAISYEYSIAATYGRDTPVNPQGPLALPGDYTVVLRVDGREQRSTLRLRQDPRVNVPAEALTTSLSLSKRIAGVLAEGRRAYGEMSAVHEQLERLGAATPAAAGAQSMALLQATDPAGEASSSLTKADGVLTSVETDLESADAAPTPAQAQVVDEAAAEIGRVAANWRRTREEDLASLNTALRRARRPAIAVPPEDRLTIRPAPGGEELP
ncbi:MAG TPA: hypothetical protein VF559_12980 [Caulobacteraceae bacterium]|jgi:hypothetical protein